MRRLRGRGKKTEVRMDSMSNMVPKPKSHTCDDTSASGRVVSLNRGGAVDVQLRREREAR